MLASLLTLFAPRHYALSRNGGGSIYIYNIFTNFSMYAQSVLVSCGTWWELMGVYEDILLVSLQLELPPLPIFRDLVALRRSRSLLVVNDDDDDDDVGGGTEESHRRACSNSRE